jgi:hypothetical protein
MNIDDTFEMQMSFKFINERTGKADLELQNYIERSLSWESMLKMQENFKQIGGERLQQTIDKLKDSQGNAPR